MKTIRNTEEIEKFIEVMDIDYRASKINELVCYINNLKHTDSSIFSSERVLMNKIKKEFYKTCDKIKDNNKIIKRLSDNDFFPFMINERTIAISKNQGISTLWIYFDIYQKELFYDDLINNNHFADILEKQLLEIENILGEE